MGSRTARGFLTIVMNILIACAILVTVRLGVAFFGQFSAQSWGKAILAFSKVFVLPFGFHAMKTPYGGVFELNTALMVAVYLLAEWVLSGVRARA